MSRKNEEQIHSNIDFIRNSHEVISTDSIKSTNESLSSSYNYPVSFTQSQNPNDSNTSLNYYKNEFESYNQPKFNRNNDNNQQISVNYQDKSNYKNQPSNQINNNNQEKLYSVKSVINNEIKPQKLTLNNIYLNKARIYPNLLPSEYKKNVERIDLVNKVNFGVFLFTIFSLFNKNNVVKKNEFNKKMGFIFGIWYFSSLVLNWKRSTIFEEAYQNMISRYTEKEIIKMINDQSKNYKILD